MVDVLPLSGICAGRSGNRGKATRLCLCLTTLCPALTKSCWNELSSDGGEDHDLSRPSSRQPSSEQIARMVKAMKAATDNADKMGKKLTQDYKPARQSADYQCGVSGTDGRRGVRQVIGKW